MDFASQLKGWKKKKEEKHVVYYLLSTYEKLLWSFYNIEISLIYKFYTLFVTYFTVQNTTFKTSLLRAFVAIYPTTSIYIVIYQRNFVIILRNILIISNRQWKINSKNSTKDRFNLRTRRYFHQRTTRNAVIVEKLVARTGRIINYRFKYDPLYRRR